MLVNLHRINIMAVLFVSCAAADMNVVAKICDVSPDGSSTLVTSGCLRISHRNGSATLANVAAGEICELLIPIYVTSYKFAKHHRIRVDISCSDFPKVWPTPWSGKIAVYHSSQYPSHIVLPVVSRAADASRPSFEPGELGLKPPALTRFEPTWKITVDRVNEGVTVEFGGKTELMLDGCRLAYYQCGTASVLREKPQDATADTYSTFSISYPNEEITVNTRTHATHYDAGSQMKKSWAISIFAKIMRSS